MSMGADRAEAQPQGDSGWTSGNDQILPASETMPFHQFEEEEEAPPRSTGMRIFAFFLVLLALGWLGASGYALTLAWPGPSLVAWIGLGGDGQRAPDPARPDLAALRPLLTP